MVTDSTAFSNGTLLVATPFREPGEPGRLSDPQCLNPEGPQTGQPLPVFPPGGHWFGPEGRGQCTGALSTAHSQPPLRLPPGA